MLALTDEFWQDARVHVGSEPQARNIRNTKLSTKIGLSKYIQQIGKLNEIQNSGNDQS